MAEVERRVIHGDFSAYIEAVKRGQTVELQSAPADPAPTGRRGWYRWIPVDSDG